MRLTLNSWNSIYKYTKYISINLTALPVGQTY